jgi:hypothetical protein
VDEAFAVGSAGSNERVQGPEPTVAPTDFSQLFGLAQLESDLQQNHVVWEDFVRWIAAYNRLGERTGVENLRPSLYQLGGALKTIDNPNP